jgi:hypothetical protein
MNIKSIMLQARFWNNVNIISDSNSSACWLWTGATNNKGYGVSGIGNGKIQLAHRLAASFAEDIDDRVVMHACDNPLCVRPDHLRIGSQQDNMHDMYVKQRSNNKLNRIAVLDIRTKALSRAAYAKKYGVSEYTIGDVQRGATWTWV